ncbi:MAG: putative urea ABC transporter substrate-binding protein [Planctomycetes bacterium]|nr:putative urea ABC transporter substrate-binding protein [Planctomycetota bacterium]
MKRVFTVILAMLLAMAFTCSFSATSAGAKTTYKVAWSHYTGWEFWKLAEHSGILAKWAKKYNIKIKLVLINDYGESIAQYTAGGYHALAVTNMDTLIGPSSGGVDTTVLVIGDFSNGNDGIVVRGAADLKALKGRKILLVQNSVSHYLLSRYLPQIGLREKDFVLVNTSDSDIAAVFANLSVGSVVTWNPPLMQVRNVSGAKMVFDSSRIPGEIIDTIVVRTDAPETLKKALAGAWYETMKLMSTSGKARDKAIIFTAKFAGGTIPEFLAQLKTTRMFYKPAEAAAFSRSPQLKKTMEYVRTFCFQKGLIKGAKTKDSIGIELPGGVILGDPKNIKMRFTDVYMKMAADGEL